MNDVRAKYDAVLETLDRIHAPTHDGAGRTLNANGRLEDWLEQHGYHPDVTESARAKREGVPDDVMETLLRICSVAQDLNLVSDEDGALLDAWLAEEPPVPCPAVLYHGPGHQSRSRCEVVGVHDVHSTHYGDGQLAEWRDNEYIQRLRERGHVTVPDWVTPGTAMTGVFDEPPKTD